MFETLTKGFRAARQHLQGMRELDEDSVAEALRSVRISLLEADVEFGVVKAFLGRVKENVLGEVVQTRIKHKGRKRAVSAEQHFIKACYDELEALMGPVDTSLRYAPYGITKVMMIGLQGSGKTTTSAKLAHFLATQHAKRPMLVAADVYRPAAVEQLKVLGRQLDVPVYSEEGSTSPPDICERAVAFARANKCDLLIYDTAGRLAIDDQLMGELEEIRTRTAPENTFLVIDSMIGQDAVKTAREFNERIGIDGVVLTKMDGDARGGAALSVKHVTGKPIKFVGMGEGLGALEEFRPEGLSSRILGFGDIVGLMKDFEQVVDEKQAEDDARRMLEGRFTLVDFLEQIRTIKRMGSLNDLFDKLPFFPDGLPDGVNIDDRELVKVEAMIQSMTPAERTDPRIIKASRARRIARGSGRGEKEVEELLVKFETMQRMMGSIGGSPGFWGNLPGIKQLRQMKAINENDLQGMMGGMQGGPGMPGMPAMPGLPGGRGKSKTRRRTSLAHPGQGGTARPDRSKDKNKRKAARRSRKQSKKK